MSDNTSNSEQEYEERKGYLGHKNVEKYGIEFEEDTEAKGVAKSSYFAGFDKGYDLGYKEANGGSKPDTDKMIEMR